ncbi:MAG: lipopolysaccharide export system permease protein [Desulfobacteraceae bacterium Eth-SRB2]|nr:MAG: lipopolysaccharide export system permease protein [Desulfobacteraceae bacterium Eth-SRB2]
MKISSIINRYVFKEMIPPFVINLMFFTFVFLMVEMLKVTNMVVNYNVGVFTVLIMLAYSTPYFLTYIIPMSIMIAVLLAFLRLSGDNEIIALKTSGMSIYGLLPPAMFFCLLGCLLTLFMTIYGMPWGRLSFKELTYKVVSSNLEIGLKDRTFNDSFEDVVLYVNKIDALNKELQDIFIEDKRTQDIVSTVVAPRGKLFKEPDEYIYHLLLFNGVLYQVDVKNRSTNYIDFETYEIRLDIKQAASRLKQGAKHRKEMSLFELRDYLKNSTRRDNRYYSTLMELHKKFSIPIACFALGLLAVPLGIQSGPTKKSFGLVLGMIFFLIYYLLLTAGLVLGETGACPPVVGMWVPNIMMGGLGLYLVFKTANDRQLRIVPIVTNLLKGIKSRLHGRGGA